jgi:AcrR family transcriptional regulator
MPKIIDYEQKKYQIMQEAVKAFIELGYFNTKLSHIAERCKMGRTTLYQYFKNKDEIFFYATDYILQFFQQNFQCIIKKTGLSNLDKINQIILLVLKECNQEQMIVLMDLWLKLKREDKTISSKVQVYLDELKHYFRILLERAIKAKEIRPVNADSMAYLLFSLIESFIFQVSFSERISIEDNMKNIEILLNGLRLG